MSLEKDLLETKTAGYEMNSAAAYDSTWMSSANPRAPLFNRIWVPAMLRDPAIRLALAAIKGPLMSDARVYIKYPKGPVKDYLIDIYTRFLRYGMPTCLTQLENGFSGSEVLYREQDNQIQYDSLKPLLARDVRPYVVDGKKTGMILLRSNNVERLHAQTNGKLYVGGMKSLWTVHKREVHEWFGESKLFGAFDPWIDTVSDGGARDVRRLYYYKYAYSGDVLYHPKGSQANTETGPEGTSTTIRSNKDVARDIVNKRRTGGTCTFPSDIDEKTGKEKWRFEPAQAGPGSVEVGEYNKDLKQEKFDGMEVPKEVVEAAEVGSGWSGRSVPLKAFYSMLQSIFNFLILDFDQQVARESIRINFSDEESKKYEVVPFGLADDTNDPDDAMDSGSGPLNGPGMIPPDVRKSKQRAA